MHKNLYLFFASFCIVVLTIISLKEADSLPNELIPYLDKIFHLLAYIVLTILWGIYLVKQYPKTNLNKLLTIVVAFLVVYGIIIEVLQSKLTVSRMFELGDLAANLLGIVLGILMFKNIIKHKLKNNKGLFF